MDCGDLNDPVNGVVAVNDTVEGSIANYICDEGFSPDGPVDRTCGSDGMWSGVPPMCEGERVFHLCLCTVYDVFYGTYKIHLQCHYDMTKHWARCAKLRFHY